MHHACLAVTLLFAAICASGQTATQVEKSIKTGFLKNLTIESFGYTRSPLALGYEFAPALTSAFYNLHSFESPLWVPGPPPDRTRAMLPPFGAKAKLMLWHDRLTLSAGFGGIDAVTFDNNSRLNPASWRATPFNDDWLVQTDAGAHITLDPKKYFSIGVTQSHINDFGPGRGQWSKTASDISFSPALFRELANGIRKASK